MDEARERRHRSPEWQQRQHHHRAAGTRCHSRSSSAGNGFIARLGELHSRTKIGNSVLTVPKGAKPMIPCPIYDIETDWIFCIHSNGKLLVFPASEVPEMARGKKGTIGDRLR